MANSIFSNKNKDWNGGLKVQKPSYTLLRITFSEENIKQNFPIKLNGQAEIFIVQN